MLQARCHFLRASVRLLALAAALVITLTPAVSLAQALPAGLSAGATVEGIAEYRLANGLQLLLIADDSKPSTTVNITYRVGSRHENYGETGMAHLLEHMVFKGTPTTRNAWSEFTSRGFRPNGTTWFDRTNYFASFAVNDANLEWYLSWQADTMVNCLIARSDLDTEMTVVRNEFELGQNNPTRVLLQRVLASMYEWHNYGKNTIGARSDIENVDTARLKAFYQRYYQPDNATLIVSGKFDAAKVLGWVARYFGPIPKPQRVISPTYTLDPPQDGEHQVSVRRSGGAPVLMMGYHVPAGSHADGAAVQILAQVLGDAPSGRLHKRVVEQQRLVAQASSFALVLAEPSPLLMIGTLAPGQDVEKARQAMVAVIDGVAGEPVTTEEFERARVQWLNSWERAFSDPERVGLALSESIALGDWRLYFLQRDRVRKLNLADVNRVAREWLRKDNRTVGLYLPTDAPERAPQASQVDVAAMVAGYQGDAKAAQAEAFDPTPATLDARTQLDALPSGLKLALLPKGTRGNVVRASLLLRFGDEQSLQGQDIVSSLLGEQLDKGGAGMTRQQIDDAFARLQAQVFFGGSGQSVIANINTRREHLDAVVALVGKLLRTPDLAPEPLEEARRQRLAELERQRKEPGGVIANAVARHGNPYPPGDLRHARSFDESERDLKAVTVAQLRAFHRRFYSAAQGEFAAVGDFDAATLKVALNAALGDWRAPADGALAYQRVPRPLVPVAPTRIVERTPDKANANLLGGLAIPLSDLHADYPALLVANQIFGYFGNSRLWKRIRENDGLSYDVRSYVSWSNHEDNSAWVFSAIFAPQNQPRVEQAFQQELAKSLREGFSAEELEKTRTGLLNDRKLARAQDTTITGALVNNLYLGRRFELSQRVDDAIARLTLDEVNAAWRKYIVPDKLVWAWGGDFKP